MEQDIREEYLKELESGKFFQGKETVGSFNNFLRRYSYTYWLRVLFRTVGILLILLSASIPVLNSYPDIKNTNIITIIGGLLTILSSLAAFFGWENRWRSRTQARNAILRQRTEWESKRAQGLKDIDQKKGLEILLAAQERLVANVFLIVDGETNERFNPQKAKNDKP